MRRSLNRRCIIVLIFSIGGTLVFVNNFSSYYQHQNNSNLYNETFEGVEVINITENNRNVMIEDVMPEVSSEDAFSTQPVKELPWYFNGGIIRPTVSDSYRYVIKFNVI